MEGVLGFIYLYVYIYTKEYKNILYLYIHKRIWGGGFVGKMKVWRKHRDRAQEAKRMASKKKMNERKNWGKKAKVIEGGK